jgi:myo-inositol-1(or 4)-monophosphatase
MMRATLETMGRLFERKIRGFRRMGAASLDLCMTGCGQLAGYFEFELAPWDFAAGQLFVTEAGGTVTDCDGRPLGLERSSILATNGHLHGLLLEAIAAVRKVDGRAAV